MSRRLQTIGVVLAAALGTVLAVPGTAGAVKPVERERYTDSGGPFPVDICGIEVMLSFEVSGVFQARPVPGSDQAFLGKDAFKVTETWETESGTLTIERHASFRETDGVKVPGTVVYQWDVDDDGDLETVESEHVYTFTFQDAGYFRLHDEDGTLLLKATGNFRASEQFDTLGDFQIGARPIPGTFEVLKDQTGQSFTDEEFCAVVEAELG